MFNSNKVAVVTGANAGLGYQVALQLARSGVTVVMACRSMERASQAQSQLLAELPDASTQVMCLDLSEPESIRSFVGQFSERVGHLDLLINNAGIVGIPMTRNSIGHELQLETNYLGPFALTGLLLPFFRNSVPGRVVNVGSLAHRFAKFDLDDINWEAGGYGPMRAYARSKLALMSFTIELNRRLGDAGNAVVALGAHPGFASTEIGKGDTVIGPRTPLGRWFNGKMEPRVPTAAQAARPIVFAACDDTVRGGEYYGPGGWLEISGEPGNARVNALARDSELAKSLWTLSESLTGISYLTGN